MSEIGQDTLPLTSEPNNKVKTSRKKWSWTWEYFESVDTEEQTGDKGEPLKRCKVLDSKGNKCGTLYINDGSTGNSIIHLLNDHEITKEGKLNKVDLLGLIGYLFNKY